MEELHNSKIMTQEEHLREHGIETKVEGAEVATDAVEGEEGRGAAEDAVDEEV